MNNTKINSMKPLNNGTSRLAISKTKTPEKKVSKLGTNKVIPKTIVKEDAKAKQTTCIKNGIDNKSKDKNLITKTNNAAKTGEVKKMINAVEENVENIASNEKIKEKEIHIQNELNKLSNQTKLEEKVIEKDNKVIANELLAARVSIKTQALADKRKTDGYFTEVVTHGVFTPPKITDPNKDIKIKIVSKTSKTNSSANEIALEAKSFLELDTKISAEVRAAVIEKLFDLADLVYKANESKFRVQVEFDKLKEKTFKEKLKLESEHSKRLADVQKNIADVVFAKMEKINEKPSNTLADLDLHDDELRIIENLDIGDDKSNDTGVESIDFTLDI